MYRLSFRNSVNVCRSQKDAQRSRRYTEPSIQLKPRVHPLGGDSSRWHGMNLGRDAMEEWERAATSTNVSARPILGVNQPLFVLC